MVQMHAHTACYTRTACQPVAPPRRLPLLYLTCCATIPTALCLTTCVNLLHLSHRKNRSSAKDVSASPFGDFLSPHPTYFDAQKKRFFSPFLSRLRMCSSSEESAQNVDPTFPVFMGTGTVSRRRGCRSPAASIESLAAAAAAVQRAFAFSVFENVDFVFVSLSLFPSALKRSAGGLIWPSEAEVECSSLGISNSHTFCRSLSFLFCHRKGASDDEGRLRRTPSPTRPLSPKTDKRPIFRTLSDKQDLLVEPLPVQITIQRVDEGGRGRIKTALVD